MEINRNALMYLMWGKSNLTLNTYMLYMTCNTFICTLILGLFGSSKITLFEDLVGKIIEAKVAAFFALFQWLWTQ